MIMNRADLHIEAITDSCNIESKCIQSPSMMPIRLSAMKGQRCLKFDEIVFTPLQCQNPQNVPNGSLKYRAYFHNFRELFALMIIGTKL